MKKETGAHPPVQLKDDLMNTAEDIAAYIGETPRRTHYMLTRGQIPGAFQRGRRWFALRSAIDEGFRRLARGEAS